MDTNDQELFQSAISDEPVSAPEPEAAPAPEPVATPEPAGQGRDERGRFAAAAGEPEPQPAVPAAEGQPQPGERDAHIPAWRLREVAEERNELRRQKDELAAQVAAFHRQQAQKEPEKVPDMFEDPNAFVAHGVRQALTPVQGQVANLVEFYSKRDAVREHGQETFNAAYDALDKALASRDPDANLALHRAQQSLDPYGEIIAWHKKTSALKEVGDDPKAWFEKQLEARLSDPAEQAKILERVRSRDNRRLRTVPVLYRRSKSPRLSVVSPMPLRWLRSTAT
jgi:hypothetical protein